MKALSLFLGLILGSSFVAGNALAQVPVIDTPAPAKTFQSPFNGERRLDDPEGRDYAKLQQLHDDWVDDMRAVGAAGAEGTNNPEWQRAHALAAKSDAAFHEALDQYVEDWSTFAYPKGFRPVVVPDGPSSDDPITRRFYIDRAKVMASILEHARSVVVPSPKIQPPHLKAGKSGEQIR